MKGSEIFACTHMIPKLLPGDRFQSETSNRNLHTAYISDISLRSRDSDGYSCPKQISPCCSSPLAGSMLCYTTLLTTLQLGGAPRPLHPCTSLTLRSHQKHCEVATALQMPARMCRPHGKVGVCPGRPPAIPEIHAQTTHVLWKGACFDKLSNLSLGCDLELPTLGLKHLPTWGR